MENNNVEQGELFKFFKEKSEGVGFTFDQLYEKCTSYVDHFEFSRELNRLVKLKLIQKREKFYFYVDPTAEIKRLLEERPELKAEMGVQETPPEPKPEPRVHLVERKKPEPEPVPEKPKAAPLPAGALRRGTAVTPIALVFYYNQETVFSTRDLYERTGVNMQVASQTVRRLAEDGYVTQIGTGHRSSTYRWSKKFRYPFPETKPEDWAWKSSRIEKMPPPPNDAGQAAVVNFGERPFAHTPPEGFKPLSGTDAHLRALDAVIERYELELAALRASREAYVASKVAQAA